MKKINFIKLAGLLTMLVMLVTLTAVFTTGVSAEDAVQAQAVWGTEEDLTIGSGTLQEALDAAAANSAVTYIQLVSDVDLGETSLDVMGGAFTFDLNGKTVTSTTYTLYLGSNVNITITDTSDDATGKIDTTGQECCAITVFDSSKAFLTVSGGTIFGGIQLSSGGDPTQANLLVTGGRIVKEGDTAISAWGESVTIAGGEVQGTLYWATGTLEIQEGFSGELTIENFTGDATMPVLPDGYSLYEGQTKITEFASDTIYTVTFDVTKYNVTVNGGSNGNVEATHTGMLLAGTEVALSITPDEGYIVDEITVDGAEFDTDTNTFTVGDQDVNVTVTFKLYQARWGTEEDLMIGSGTLQEALDAAAANSAVTYIQLVSDVDSGETSLDATGGAFTLDLNGKTVTSTSYTLYFCNSVSMTITDTSDGANGKIESTDETYSAIVPMDDSAVSLTVSGGSIIGGIKLDNSGSPTQAELIVTGGRIVKEGDKAISAWGKSVTIKGGEVQGTLLWATGTLEIQEGFSGELTIENFTGEATMPVLPDGYSLYEGGTKITEFAIGTTYTVTLDVAQYNVTVNGGSNGSVEATHTGVLLTGTEVTLSIIPDEGYMVDEITVVGAELDTDTNTFTVGDQDVTVNVTFKQIQAYWGTDADNLTGMGTLQEALDAAAADSAVTYIQLVSDVTDDFDIQGGAFTLDLNGKNMIRDSIVLTLGENDAITITDSGEGGTIKTTAEYVPVIVLNGGALTISGGVINGRIDWESGTLSIEQGFNSPLHIRNISDEAKEIDLPAGYSLYDEDGDKVIELIPDQSCTVAETKFALDTDISDGVVVALDESYKPGESVSFSVVLVENYAIKSVAITDAAGEPVEITYDADSDTYSFTMPESDAKLTVVTKYQAFVWGTSADDMPNTGDFHDLVAAINEANGTVVYAKQLTDYVVNFYESELVITGKAIIDVTDVTLYLQTNSEVILEDGAELTFFAETYDSNSVVNWDNIDELPGVGANLAMKEGSKLTVDGARLGQVEFGYCNIRYYGGTLDVSGADPVSDFYLSNFTQAELTLADALVLGTRMVAFDDDYQRIDTLGAYSGANICTTFTVSFDLGKGSGSVSSVEIPVYVWIELPTGEGFTHPEGKVIVGWSLRGALGNQLYSAGYTHHTYANVTLEAVWGSPVYLGGIGLNNGDYLAVGATETTKTRPSMGGYAYYNDGVLLLNNYTFEGDGVKTGVTLWMEEYYAVLYAASDLTIELVGTNALIAQTDDDEYYSSIYEQGILVAGNLTVKGNGSLQVDGVIALQVAKDLEVLSGQLALYSEYDYGLDVWGNMTVRGGRLYTFTYSGEYVGNKLHIVDGEMIVSPYYVDSYNDLYLGDLVIEGGKLIVNRLEWFEIYNDMTVLGGLLDVAGESGIRVDSDVTISGGKINIDTADTGIYAGGDIIISGGVIDIFAIVDGIYADGEVIISGGDIYIGICDCCVMHVSGNLTISGGELDGWGFDGLYVNGDVIISGGDIYLESYDGGSSITAFGDATVNGGKLILVTYGEETYAITCNGTLTLDGKQTVLSTNGVLEAGEMIVAEDALVQIVSTDNLLIYEGIEVTHTWSKDYNYNDTHHWHACTDEDCYLNYWGSDEMYENFAQAEYAEHTIPEGEDMCSVCVPVTEDTPEIPVDTLVIIGDNFLANGDYLTNAGEIVTEQPDGGYAYVIVSDDQAKLVLHDFTFTYTGTQSMIRLAPGEWLWIIELQGNNELTAISDEQDTFSVGLELFNNRVALMGNGSLVINADMGITMALTTLVNYDAMSLTLNTTQDAIYMTNSMFKAQDLTLNINSENGDGIEAMDSTILINSNCVISIVANDGFILDDSNLSVSGASELNITAGDDGICMEYSMLEVSDGAILNITAGDDAIDGSYSQVYWDNANITLNADDNGIDLSYSTLYANDVVLNITAKEDAMDLIYCYDSNYVDVLDDYVYGVMFVNSTLRMSSECCGLYADECYLTFDFSKVEIITKANSILYSELHLYGTEMHVQAVETALEMDDDSELHVYDGAVLTLNSLHSGIVALNDYGYRNAIWLSGGELVIDAPISGIVGYVDIMLGIDGSRYDELVYGNGYEYGLTVRAKEGIVLQDGYLYVDNGYGSEYISDYDFDSYEDYDHYMNVYFDGYDFLNADDSIASEVIIRTYNKSIEQSITKLEQLLAQGGSIDQILAALTELYAQTETLTDKAELLEQADVAINAALEALEEQLDTAVADLEEKIAAKADAEEIAAALAAITARLDALEALNAGDRLTATENAIAALEKAVAAIDLSGITTNADAITALQTTVTEMQTTLESFATSEAVQALSTELTALSEQLTAMEERLAAAESAIEELEAAIEALNALIEAKADAEEIAAALAAVTARLDALEALNAGDRLTATESAIAALEKAVAAIDLSGIATNKTAIDTLNTTVSALQTTVESLATTEAVKALSATLTQTQADLTALATRVEAAEKAIEELKTVIEGFRDMMGGNLNVSEINAQLAAITERLEALENDTKIDEIEAVLTALGETVAAIDLSGITINAKAITALQATVTEMQTALEGLATTEAVEALSTELTTLSETLTAMEERLAAAESAIEELEAAVDALNALIEAKADAQTVTEALAAVTERLDAVEAIGASDRLDAVESVIAALEKAVAAIDLSGITTNAEAITALQTTVTEMQTALEGFATSEAVDALSAELSALSGEIDAIKTRLDAIDTAIEQLEAEMQRLDELVAAGDYEQLNESLTKLNQALAALNGIDAGNRLSVLEAELDSLAQTVQEMGDKLNTADAQITANKQEITKLADSVSNLQTTVASLAQKDETLAAELSALSNSLATLSGKLEAVEQQIAALEAKDAELAAKDEELAAKDAELAAKDEELAAKDAELESKYAELADQLAQLKAASEEDKGCGSVISVAAFVMLLGAGVMFFRKKKD